MTAKSLGLRELIAIGVGGMIGGGIFSVLGLAVDAAGHAAPLSFLIGSLIAFVAGYSYIKLALAYRSDGASFTYLERAFPRTPTVAGIAGWTVVVGYVGTLSLYAFTFGAYASHLLGVTSVSGARGVLSGGVLLAFMAINLIGAKAMGRAEDLVVYVKIVFLTILAVVGMLAVQPDRFVPLFDRGVPSVFLGGAVIFVAYEGFQLITNAVVETSRPERNIPRGIYGSILITSTIYLVIAVVAVGTMDAATLHGAEEYALAVVARPLMGRAGVVLVDLAAMLATASAVNATVFGASRLAANMATDSLAPRVFSFHNRTGVPAVSTIVITALALTLTAFGDLTLIASFSSMTFLLVSIGVTVANLKLRQTTGSAISPILSGLLLMTATVGVLIYDLLLHDRLALGFSVGIYLLTAAGYAAFRGRLPR